MARIALYLLWSLSLYRCNSSSARSLPEWCCHGGAMGFWLEQYLIGPNL